jgi:hypothetical protein
MDSFQDDPQYKGMKYLVFGTILSSLLSELHIIIPKADRSGVFVSSAIAYPRLLKTAEAVPGVVPCCCAASLDSPMSWPPSSPVLLSFSVAPLGGTAYGTIVRARPPAAAPAGGCVGCRVPAPGLPPSSPMPRGPPPRAPQLFPECRDADGNRIGADSCAPVGPAAASCPGFHIRWPPSCPRVSARAIPVSVDGRGPPADARVPRFTMNFFHP